MAAPTINLANYRPVTSVLGTSLPSSTSPKGSYVDSLSSLNLGNLGQPTVPGITNKNVLPANFGGLNSSNGATAPVPTTITPATTTPAISAAKNNYVSSQTSSSPPITYDYNTGLPLAPGQAQSTINAQGQVIGAPGSTNIAPSDSSATSATYSSGQPQTETPSTVQAYTQNPDGSYTYSPYVQGEAGAPGTSPATVNTGNPTYDAAINSYLTALSASDAVDANVQKQTLAANNNENAAITAPGGTLGGNQATASTLNREDTLGLANLGVSQTSATNAKNEALQAAQFAQSALPTPATGFTLSPGETRYDANGNQVASSAASAVAPKTIGSPAEGVYTQNADGSWTQTLAPVGGDNVQSIAQGLVTGVIAPQDLSKRSSGIGSINDIIAAAQKIDPSFNIAKATTDYNFANNVGTQNTLNYLGSLVGSSDGTQPGNLDQLINLSKEVAEPKGLFGLGQSQFPALNDATQWAKLSAGDPTVAAYYATLLETSDQVAKVLQGGGNSGTSDAKLAQAQSLFQKGFTKDQIAAVAGTLKTLLANRAQSMIGDNPYLSTYAQEFGITQNNNLPGNSGSSDSSNSSIYDF